MIKSGRFIIGTSPVNLSELLEINKNGGVGFTLKNNGPSTLFVGGSENITTGTDTFSMADGDSWEDNLKSGDTVWVISSTSTSANCIVTGAR
jgi:hypothetical protein